MVFGREDSEMFDVNVAEQEVDIDWEESGCLQEEDERMVGVTIQEVGT